jgi:acetylornithine deacetylase
MGADTALDALDPEAIARDTAALVRIPSMTGDERAALERLAELAEGLGLRADLHRHDLDALRAHPGHPGEEAARAELWGLAVTLPGRDPEAPRIALDGHVDVVGPGAEAWERDPWSGERAGGFVHGRGSADMKGGVVAALHALGAIARTAGAAPGEVVLLAVGSEEDGGLGTFAALERDDRFDACLIPEPTGFDVVCAQAGALTFAGVVRGRGAHGALRLRGESAIDRYLAIHDALAAHERAINAEVEHPLMRELELPYPISVGRLEAGTWSSAVPDLLRFEGRVGVRIDERLEDARAALEAAASGAEITWAGGAFAPGETAGDHPWVRHVAAAAAVDADRPPRLAGVPYGTDLRLFTQRGIPTVLCGTGGIERAHAVDERVAEADLARLARTIVRATLGPPFGGVGPAR